MNLPLLAHLWRANRGRLAIVALALAVWGALPPIIFDAFGAEIGAIVESGLIPEQFMQFTRFGGGDLFSLAGSVALGVIHPISVGLGLVFAVGFAGAAVAGERQRGTLEVLLARPISRRVVYGTVAVAAAAFVGVAAGGLVIGTLLGSASTQRVAELVPGNLPVLWLNIALLFWAIAAVALAASVSFDRATPAIGAALAFVLVSYFLDVLGDLWPDAAFLQPYSVFHYLDARGALSGLPDPTNFLVLGAVITVAVGYALVVFPRRDLAAPS
jgi:ABC-type transport system involved in multi-copper enzyme maturation permease subunit